MESLYILAPDSDVNPLLGGLLGMLRYVRQGTLRAIRDLSVEQLDHRHDADSNSIGALLMHIAAVETWYQIHSFEGRDFSAEEEERWTYALELGDEAARRTRGRTLDDYVALLTDTRARTERELMSRDDAWLREIVPIDDEDADNYWKWFHVCEDEIHHRGQIRWLRKRLP